MTAEIINFQSRQIQTAPGNAIVDPKGLNDLKIRFIDYFRVEAIKKVHLAPVNLKCRYEKELLKICALLSASRSPTMVQDLAEYIFLINTKGLTLAGFVHKVNQDDLIMACLQVELDKLSQLDKLFLVNVIKTKFPKEESTISLLKMFLFAKDQAQLLEPQKALSINP